MRYVRRPFLRHILFHHATSPRAARLSVRLRPAILPYPDDPFPPARSTVIHQGSNGCGGICQAVTHPHGRILGYVFARSLPPTFHPCHVLFPFLSSSRFRPRAVTFLAVRTCIRLSIRRLVCILRQPSVHFFYRRDITAHVKKKRVVVSPSPSWCGKIRFAWIQRESRVKI